MNVRTTINTRSALLLLTAGSVALLAGCGGGGGNGNTTGTTGTTGTMGTGTTGTSTGGSNTGGSSTSQIVGKVTDTFGKGVPGVSIAVDTGGQIATTISTGGYRLTNLSVAVHKISAAVTVGSVQYTGSTQVATTAGNLNSNVNILLSPFNQQTTVQGFVRDTSGNPVAGASVYAAVQTPALAANGGSGNYSSLVAFTDSTGFYQIANIPSSLPSGSLLVTASSPATANQSASIIQNSLTPGSVATQNFTLTPSTNAVADTPVIVGINSFTQPTDGLVGSALQARLASGSGSVYESLRRRLSPSYAAFAARKRTLSKRLASRAAGGAYAVEIDLGFNPPAATDINLLGYNVYRTTGSVTTNPPIEAISGAKADFHDSLIDPQANYYTDVTASGDPTNPQTPGFDPYLGGTQYNFALSSLASSTTNASKESPLSVPYSITPLSLLTLTAPTAGQTVISPVTISWTPVTGATKYYVFLYAQYPTIGTVPLTFSPTPFPAGTNSATVTLSGGSATYYAVVVAAADETETAPSATITAPTATVNAAQSYSEITQFIVQ